MCAVIRFHASGFYLCAAWTRESLCGSDQSKHDLVSTGVLCFHLKYLAPPSREEGLSLPSVLLSLAADLARQMMGKRILGASSVFQRSDRKEVGHGLAEDLRGDLTLGKSSAELKQVKTMFQWIQQIIREDRASVEWLLRLQGVRASAESPSSSFSVRVTSS